MTFRQVLDVLWQRKWLIVATVVLVMFFAFLYLSRLTPTYTSTVTLRLSPSATATADGGDSAGIQLDTDPEQITSPTVMKLVDPEAADADPETLAGSVSYTLVEDVRTTKIQITTQGASPEQAQRRANGVGAAYIAFLQQQVDDGLADLKQEKRTSTRAIAVMQRGVTANPDDQLASTNLATALSRLVEIDNQINAIENAGPPVSVLTVAGPGTRTGTAPATVMLVALVAGLLAGIGIALIRDQFDDRIRSEREAEGLTDAPSLGEIALQRGRKKDDRSLPIATRALTPFTESIRALRTSIQVLVPAHNAAVLLTSAEPGDGKSFVTANLALSWAKTGRSVILVGGDLRRPRLDWYFGESAEGYGFADLIREAKMSGRDPDADQISVMLNSTGHTGLKILPPGSEPVDPADLLASEPVGSIIATLRDLADVVLIDSPPALALADAAILSPHTHGVVVLANLGGTDRETLSETVNVLRAKGATILGIVGNRSRRILPKSYGSYYLPTVADQKEAVAPGHGPQSFDGTQASGARPPATQGAKQKVVATPGRVVPRTRDPESGPDT